MAADDASNRRSEILRVEGAFLGSEPSQSICIVTYERLEYLRRCLTSIRGSVDATTQIIVVDASRTSAREMLDPSWNALMYFHKPELAGWMTRARNEALRHADGEVISFLDDDVVVSNHWQSAIRSAFLDDSIQSLAGRTRNGLAGEEEYPLPIGRLQPDGTLTAGFASLPDKLTNVDHGIGANMSFRRSLLARLGGFRDDYPGTAMREDTDIFLRARRLGVQSVFAPDAVVDHLPAPHVRGARFDTRYKLYGRRNHVVLLARDSGIGSTILRRWVVVQFRSVAAAPTLLRRIRRLGVVTAGVVWGFAAALRQASWGATSPVRSDALGQELSAVLGRAGPADSSA
ncbi:MAG TPA: glycosyltransferase [Microbacteriaceae bacterium]|jgi:GT2 family glycosyltransferase|nr:glycosyltransferase [Microbacteriaceae bacterium]